MSDINPLLRFPLEVQEEVENLRCNNQNALMITKIIESKFATDLLEKGAPVPTFNDINKYVKWAKKNRGTVISKQSPTDDLLNEMDAEEEATLTEMTKDLQRVDASGENSVLQTSIDLSTPKNTLEDVKKRLQLSIQRLEKKRISLGDEYNDKLEVSLRGYYESLAKLTHTEVKMAEELKDSDKIDVATINFILNKLFQCVFSTIKEVDADKSSMFYNILKDKITNTKNKVLEDILKEL
jgi:hypothetical protein